MTNEQKDDDYVFALEAQFMLLATQLILLASAASQGALDDVSEYDVVVQGLRKMAELSSHQEAREAARDALALLERMAQK